MTEQEIVASNTQLVFAGNETTAKLLGADRGDAGRPSRISARGSRRPVV